MSKTTSYRDGSRDNWGRITDDQGSLSIEQIQTGAFLRIADATEVMAKRYTELIEQRDRYEKFYRHEQRQNEHLKRRLVSLRGYVTRLKKKVTP
jgi:hypothetical protein